MSNMSYCRFENTLKDLQDCYDAIHNQDSDDLSPQEANAKELLIGLCIDISNENN